MSYRILGLAASTCTRTVVTVMEEVGAKYEIQTVNLAKQEQKAPEYTSQFQPFGQIPVLIDGDFKVFESRAIIRYVAAKHNAETLYPTDLKKRALVEQWLSVNQSNNTPVTDAVVEYVFKPRKGGVSDASKIPEYQEKLKSYFSILDSHLASSTYLAGEDFTIADASFLSYNYLLLAIPGFETSMEEHTNLKRWWGLISERPSWKKASGQL